MSFFKLEERNTNVKQELIAGITTFLTMAYIIFINPMILGEAGMDKGALITATCLAAFAGTSLAGLIVNAPLAMAPGMGLNAFFTYTLVLGMGVTWNVALGVVFISGIVFVVLTATGFRQKIIDAIPNHLRLAVGAGIGLFIAFIGMKDIGLIVANPATLVGLGKIDEKVVLGLVAFIIMGVLELKRVKGGILIGIVVTTILGIVLGLVELPTTIFSLPASIAPIALKLDILGALKVSMIAPIFSFMFVDLFDSVGTIVACANEAGMINEDGTVQDAGKILGADACATVIGSLLGTSTTTTFVESTAGIAEGGRTGLTAITTAVLFIFAMFFGPVIGIVPVYATAPALIIVGVYMFKNLIDINLKDMAIAIPSFLTIILMPLTYSISTGITFGFISFGVIEVVTGRTKEIKPTMWIIIILSVIELVK